MTSRTAILVTLILAAASAANTVSAKSNCPDYWDPIHLGSQWSSAATSRDRAWFDVSSTTTAVTSLPTVTSSHVFGTSGCDKAALREYETEHFVATVYDDLLREMAEGRGERLSVLGALLGCDAAGKTALARRVQSRFWELATNPEPQPRELLARVRVVLRDDGQARAHCTFV